MPHVQGNDDRPLLPVGAPQGAAGGISWRSASSLIVANMLGAGVLGLPLAVKRMGLAGAVLLLLAGTGMSIYGGLLLGRLRGSNAQIKTYGDLAAHCARNWGPSMQKASRYCVQAIAYSYILGSMTIYLITMRISVMGMFQRCTVVAPSNHGNYTSTDYYSGQAYATESTPTESSCTTSDCGEQSCSPLGKADLHQTTWLLITAALTYPFIHFRSMDDATPVAYLGVITIAVVNVIIIVRAVIETQNHQPPDCPYDRSFSVGQCFVFSVLCIATGTRREEGGGSRKLNKSQANTGKRKVSER